MDEILVPANDIGSFIDSYADWRAVGAYKANEPFTIFVDKSISNESERKQVYMHEYTHLHMVTSTSFGHAQQVTSKVLSYLVSNSASPARIEPLKKVNSLMHEVAWEVHEGVATIAPYLTTNMFSHSIVEQNFFHNLPTRYQNAASVFSTAVGGLIPVELASFGYVVANAVAQYCLNTSVIDFFVEYIRSWEKPSLANYYALFEHISKPLNHPSCRLYSLVYEIAKDNKWLLPQKIKDDFINSAVKLLPCREMNNGSYGVILETSEQLLNFQDLLNVTVLDTLECVFPNTLAYKHSAGIASRMPEITSALQSVGIMIHYDSSLDLSKDISKRARFEPTLVYY